MQYSNYAIKLKWTLSMILYSYTTYMGSHLHLHIAQSAGFYILQFIL